MGMRCVEKHVKKSVKDKLGGRSPSAGPPTSPSRRNRQACHYCGPCERGCATHSYFNSAFTTVADALKTGNCTLVTNAMVYKVLTDPVTHKARGVLYIDRVTREPKEVEARAVILSAQALESARILLNSKSEQDPNGLANSSGAVGHYLMDHTWVAGAPRRSSPTSPGTSRPSASGPDRPDGIYVIRFRTRRMAPGTSDLCAATDSRAAGTPTSAGRSRLRRRLQEGPAGPHDHPGLVGFGEVLPRYENFVAIDPNVNDAFGVPVLGSTWPGGTTRRP